MSLSALSWPAFAAGLAAVAAALFVLHWLRVRLRRVTVPTLLFFAQAAAPARPRVLFGSPRRLLAYLLALVTLGLCWLAFAEPQLAHDGPSRWVLLDASGAAAGEVLPAHVDAAAGLAAAGLGPRGRVLAWQAGVIPLWRAGEAPLRLRERAQGLVATGGGGGLVTALATAREALRAGDQVLLLGGPADLPPQLGAIGLTRQVRAGGQAAAIPSPAPPPPATPIPVFVAAGLPESVPLALAAEPLFQLAPAESAQLRIETTRTRPDVPTLLVEAGVGSAMREPLLTDDAPFALSLRDRRRKAAALAPAPDEVVWVRDATSQAPLVASRQGQVRICAWLLAEAGHIDAPVLVLGALRLLADRAQAAPAARGDQRDIPAIAAAPLAVGAMQVAPVHGAYRVVVADGPLAAASPWPVTPTAATPPGLAAGLDALWLALALALVGLAADALLHARGRIP